MYSAALDSSTPCSSFMVMDAAGKIVVQSSEMPGGRDSSCMLDAILTLLDSVGLDLKAVSRWTVGMGPGSFTGIRSGAALVQGICLTTGALCRGVPSSLAMACAATGTVAVCHDGRRDEVLLSKYRVTDGNAQPIDEPCVISVEALSREPVDCFVMLESDRICAELKALLDERLLVLPRLDTGKLIAAPWETWTGSMEPVYVRPAVFVKPALVRIPQPVDFSAP